MNENLILYVLHRHSAGLTASAVADMINEVVAAEGLPRSLIAKEIPKVAGLLKAMRNRGQVAELSRVIENGRSVPVWVVSGPINPNFPLPDLEAEAAGTNREQLESLSPEQRFELFDTMRMLLDCQHRHLSAITQTIERNAIEYSRDLERARARMVATGLGEKLGL